jgi:hypothetical protein
MMAIAPDPRERSSLRRWARLVARAFAALDRAQAVFKACLGFVILAAGPALFLAELGSDQNLASASAFAAFVLLLYALVLGGMFAAFAHALSRHPEREHVGTAALVGYTGFSATAFLLAAAGESVGVMAQHGITVSLDPPQSRLDLGDINGKAFFEALDVLPLLDIPATLGWEDPVPDPAAPLGWVLVLVTLLMVLVVVSASYQLVARSRWPSPPPIVGQRQVLHCRSRWRRRAPADRGAVRGSRTARMFRPRAASPRGRLGRGEWPLRPELMCESSNLWPIPSTRRVGVSGG